MNYILSLALLAGAASAHTIGGILVVGGVQYRTLMVYFEDKNSDLLTDSVYDSLGSRYPRSLL
jgi:hypothetical protein